MLLAWFAVPLWAANPDLALAPPPNLSQAAWAELQGRHKDTKAVTVHARSVALYIARHRSDRTLRELAQLAGNLEYPAVTMAIRRLEQRLKFDRGLAKKTRRVLSLLQGKT